MDNSSQSSAPQFRPMIPNQQGQPFLPSASQQFQPVGQGMPHPNLGMPGVQSQPMHFSQPMQPYPPRPGQGGHAMPSSQGLSMSYIQTRPIAPGPPQTQQPGPPPFTNQMPGGAGMPFSSPYSFAPSSFTQPQNNANSMPQFPSMPQMQAPIPGQPWLPSGSQSAPAATPVQQTGHQPSAASSIDTAMDSLTQQSLSDWQEHSSTDGRRYYYNKRTKQSVWDKPLELMTPMERADASTVWKEYSSPDGRKYYYNKVTKQSKWTIPEELKLARELAEKEGSQGSQLGTGIISHGSAAASSVETLPPVSSVALTTSLAPTGIALSPVSVTPVASLPNPSVGISGSSAAPTLQSTVTSSVGVNPPMATVASLTPVISGTTGVPSFLTNANTTPMSTYENQALQDSESSEDGASMQDLEDARKGMAVAGKINVTTLEEKLIDEEPLVYASKLEAKSAFKSLLESTNVQSDWTWEQTMREIVNDKRYGALRTLGERKQAFNEYLGQRKKLEAEEKRTRQKKAREEFTKMLEESKELTSSTRWSKAVTMFENDERFKAVERARDKEDLFESYIVELERKEKEHAAEEHRQNGTEYRKFLESCEFIKVNSQWRKVQDRLEDDERYLRLEKLDRLLIFQDYVRDLEKEEEEQKKIQKDHLRRVERKNRDEFRKLMEEHIAIGSLTARTYWRDYCLKVKDLSQYQAIASNTSGSTPKDLFEDVIEELEKHYHEDKARVKDVLKLGKVSIVSTWTFDDFKAAILEQIGSPLVSDINLKLVFEDIIDRAKEKEEKEAKKRQRLADEFTKLLYTFKEITSTSTWDDCKQLFEESQEYRSIGEESLAREIFEEYIIHLLEKAKERERKREEEKARKEKERDDKEKRKEKERKEKDRDKEKSKERSKKDDTDSENIEISDSHCHKEDKKREKDKDRKHRKRHLSVTDDMGSDKDEKDDSKKRKHSSDRKKSRKHAHSPETDSESRHKKHRREHRDLRRNGGLEELEDGELGEDGEIP